jgi:hypothetical protein
MQAVLERGARSVEDCGDSGANWIVLRGSLRSRLRTRVLVAQLFDTARSFRAPRCVKAERIRADMTREAQVFRVRPVR